MAEIRVLVDGGKASAGAPLGPALGPLGVNIGEIVNKINEKTKSYSGMKVPIKVIVDTATKSFEIKVGSPPTSALIKKELGVPKGGKDQKTDIVGNLSIDQVKKIAEMKIDNLSAHSLRAAVREVVGACNSMGVTVDGMAPKEMQDRIAQGNYDSALN